MLLNSVLLEGTVVCDPVIKHKYTSTSNDNPQEVCELVLLNHQPIGRDKKKEFFFTVNVVNKAVITRCMQYIKVGHIVRIVGVLVSIPSEDGDNKYDPKLYIETEHVERKMAYNPKSP